MAKYSIVVPTFNHCEDLLKPCIVSLIRYVNFDETEIIIVANSCTDGTFMTIHNWAKLSYIKYIWIPERVGFTKATNEGIKKAKGEYIIFLNNDIIFQGQQKNHIIDRFQKLWDSVPNPGVVGIATEDIFDKKFVAFYCAMTSRKIIDEIGLLDETFESGGEDIDFCMKVQNAGYQILAEERVYDPDGTKKQWTSFPIWHKGEATIREDLELHNKNLEQSNQILKERYQPMKYSIIIPTYNHCHDLLKPCIESIEKYTDLKKDIQIIIVANGCIDDTVNYLSTLKHPFVSIYFSRPLGFAQAINEGIKVASGDYIILLNNDTELLTQPKGQWLAMLEQPFNEDPDIGITGPILNHLDGVAEPFLIFFIAMIKRRVIDDIGLLNEEYEIGGGEDIEFCVKAQRAGYKLGVVPSMPQSKEDFIIGGFPIHHKAEKTVGENPDWKEIFDANMERTRKNLSTEEKIEGKDFIGIVMPCHNAENTIQKAIECVLNQTYREWFLVVVDDNSTDQSLKIIDMLINENYQTVRIHSDEQKGQSFTRNYAMDYILEKTGATHIAFCDSDDYWEPDHLEKTMKSFNRIKKDINDSSSFITTDRIDAYCSVPNIFDEKGKFMIPFGIDPTASPSLKNVNNANNIFISTVIMSIDIPKTIGGFNSKYDCIEDWEYWIRALKKGFMIIKGHDSSVSYTVREEGMAGKITKEQIHAFRQEHPLQITNVTGMLPSVPDIPKTEHEKIQEKTKEDGMKLESDLIRLNLGCGDEILPDYINCDAYGNKADQIFDAKEVPFADNSVAEIRAYHLIEHFTFETAFKVLREWWRVLKPGGRLIMETPDLYFTAKEFTKLYEARDPSAVNLYGHFFAFPDLSPGQVHYFLYTEIQMFWTLGECGYVDFKRMKPDSMYANTNPQWESLYLKVEAFKPLAK